MSELASLIAGFSQRLLGPGGQCRKAVHLAGEDLREAVKADTPVDTGLLRDSWSLEGEGEGLVLTNPQPYAEAIEYGHSRRAPRGMLRRNAERFGEFLSRRAGEAGS